MMPRSDLKSHVEARFGDGLKQPAIFVLNPVVKSPAHLRRLLRRYLDERRKRTVTNPDQVSLDPNDEAYTAAIMRKEAPLRPGIDYVPSGAGLHCFGAAKRAICAVSDDPSKLGEEEVVEALVRWWSAQTKDHVKQAYHMEYSLDPRLSLEMGRRGIPVDPIIISAAAKTMFEYNSRFFPEGVIGFVIGVHHDKPSAHAHALLFPRLSTGKGLNVSNNSKVQIGGQETVIHFQDMLQGSFYRQADRLRRELETRQPNDAARTRMVQEVLVALSALQNLRSRGGQEAKPEVSAIVQERESLLDDRHLATRLAEVQDAEKAKFKAGPVNPADAARFATLFKKIADDARAAAAATRKDAQTISEQFSEHDNARAYRRVFYAKTHPQSPSGTRSFLTGTLVEGLADLHQLPPDEGFDLRETKERAAAIMHKQERSNILLRQANETLRGMTERFATGTRERFVRAMTNSLSALTIGALARGDTPLFLQPADFAQLRVHSAQAHRADIAAEVKDQMKREAWDHRPYSREEFSETPRAAWMRKPLGTSVPVTDSPAAATPAVIPEGPNFLARNLASTTSDIVRDIASLDQEDRMQRSDFERLLRARGAQSFEL
ncbi:MAG TPA: hypothetical protein VGD81_15500 [Opitutaceae bacterium]